MNGHLTARGGGNRPLASLGELFATKYTFVTESDNSVNRPDCRGLNPSQKCECKYKGLNLRCEVFRSISERRLESRTGPHFSLKRGRFVGGFVYFEDLEVRVLQPWSGDGMQPIYNNISFPFFFVPPLRMVAAAAEKAGEGRMALTKPKPTQAVDLTRSDRMSEHELSRVEVIGYEVQSQCLGNDPQADPD
uniref:Uncharacterized protein n=1 Tax=Timema cristinae TaxID=61476 RepID=A0A7R9CPL5_TIMCR|nr:unnamed protein product [Timema cristinae]